MIDGTVAGADETSHDIKLVNPDDADSPIIVTVKTRKPTFAEKVLDEQWSVDSWGNGSLAEAAANRFIRRLAVITGWSGVTIKKRKGEEVIEEDFAFSQNALEAAVSQSREFRQGLIEVLNSVF